MKGKHALLALIIASVFIMPTILITNNVSAQSSGYTIPNVEHYIEVLFSGHTVIRDEIDVSGSVANGFQMGIPSKYASHILKVVAFDTNREYPVTVGTQLGGQSGFYGVQVDFQGQSPSAFTVEFVLSNDLISQSSGYYYFDYPTYPAFTTAAAQCKVTLSLPAEPSYLTIAKSDGNTNSTYIYKTNLPAYTNAPALATFYVTKELLQLVDISTYTRTLNVSPSGSVSCQETYNLKSLDTNSIFAFMLCLPTDAKNIVPRPSAGVFLSSQVMGSAGTTLLVNTTLPAYLSTGQTAQLTVDYTLPDISLGSNNVTLFPTFNFLVDKAAFTITLPEGATITTADSSAIVTTSGYEQKLTLTRNDVTYVEYTVPGGDFIQFNYGYSPFWASYRPTIIVFGLSAVGCAGVIFWTTKRKSDGGEKKIKPVIVPKKTQPVQTKTLTTKSLKTTPELIQRFLDDYELRTELIKEQEALDEKVQKGRIPRSQYKNQKNALTSRIEGLTHSINGAEGVFRYSSPEFADLMEQLEQVEEELEEANQQVKTLELQRKSGEINIEQYKENIGGAQQDKEKAESTLNGILLQLREKIQ
jgi:hypothetical protein